MISLLNVLLVVFSIIGISDAGFITYQEMWGSGASCSAVHQWGFNCSQVLQSDWAHIGPLPISALGLGFYVTMFLVASTLLVLPRYQDILRKAVVLLSTGGFLFTLWLIFLQAFVLHSFCLYCVISAVTSISLFLISLGYFFLTKEGHDSSDS